MTYVGADVDVVLIAAVADNGVIGVDGELPWSYPEDLQHFRRKTVGHPVIAGRVTHEGIVEQLGHPLEGRESLVLTRQGVPEQDGVVSVESVEEALDAAAQRDSVVYVIGGASVYEQFFSYADRVIITEIPESPDGDTTFPEWDVTQWQRTNVEEDGALRFVTYERET